MGNKETKVDVDQFLQIADSQTQLMEGKDQCDLKGGSRERSGSKQALAGCLASLSDMAATGVDTALPDMPAGLAMAALDPAETGPMADISPNTFRRMSSQLRHKLERRSPRNEEARKQLLLLDGLMTQEDSQDWASMRNWMVWCIHANLDDDDETSTPTPSAPGRRRLSRQTSMDATRRLQLNHQDSFEMNNGRVSAQSSLESNGET